MSIIFAIGLGIAIIGAGVRGLPVAGEAFVGSAVIILGGVLVALSPFLH